MRGNIRGWVGVPPQKEYSYFTRFARTEFNLPKANFTREAYLTAEGDFTAASAARVGAPPRAVGSQLYTAAPCEIQLRRDLGVGKGDYLPGCFGWRHIRDAIALPFHGINGYR